MSQNKQNLKTDNIPEFEEKLVNINKVSKTVKGGKNFSFSAFVIIGDKKGRVGFGKGNAREVMDAKKKASDAAKKSMIKVPLKEGRTLHHDIIGRFCSAKVNIRTAPPGTGVIAGGAMRAVFECLGVHDIVAKSIGTSNPYNMVKATFAALKLSVSPKIISERRSKDVSDIIKIRNSS